MGEFKPNFFIGLPISNSGVVSKMKELQNSLIETKSSPSYTEFASPENLRRSMVNPRLFHFTLSILKLNESEDIPRSTMIFNRCCKKIHEELKNQPLDLVVGGVGFFGNSVMFAKIRNEEQIERLRMFSQTFKNEFENEGFPGDSRPFQPHMTICNLYYLKEERGLPKPKNIHNFPTHLLSRFETENFGTQRVKTVQLLRMKGLDRETGYYHTVAEYNFE